MTNETISTAEVIRVLDLNLGPSLVALMAGAERADAIRWSQGGAPNVEQEAQLRAGYEVFTMLAEAENPGIAFALMMGMNPRLDDNSMIHVIAEGRHRDAVMAAKGYLENGW